MDQWAKENGFNDGNREIEELKNVRREGSQKKRRLKIRITCNYWLN